MVVVLLGHIEKETSTMNMAERIKEKRLEAGLTQEELADRLGLKKSAIAKYENGRVENIKRSVIQKMSVVLNCSPSYLMGWNNSNDIADNLPSNISLPAAHGVPILGTICAGNGVFAEENFDGYFFVDHSIKADCCLYVRGDSMIEAGIMDGDIAFLKRDTDIADGDIYGVVLKDTDEAVLKKLYRSDGHLILQPCNANYKPIIEEPENVSIVGEMIGVYHKTK